MRGCKVCPRAHGVRGEPGGRGQVRPVGNVEKHGGHDEPVGSQQTWEPVGRDDNRPEGRDRAR
eukprot:5747911-Lingulodinium_polyedra.AAC.1